MSTQVTTATDTRERNAPSGADAAFLVLRVVMGALFIGHGTGKLLGWFGQSGLAGTTTFFHNAGYDPAQPLAIFDGIAETAAGVLLLVGFLVPLAAAGLMGDMANASLYKSPHGFWITGNGFEYEFFMIFALLALVIAGAGAYSIDRKGWYGGPVGRTVIAIIVAAIGGGVFAFMRK